LDGATGDTAGTDHTGHVPAAHGKDVALVRRRKVETASKKTVAHDGRAFVRGTTGAETNGDPLPLLESTVKLTMDCNQIKQPTGSVTFSGGAWANLSSAGE